MRKCRGFSWPVRVRCGEEKSMYFIRKLLDLLLSSSLSHRLF